MAFWLCVLVFFVCFFSYLYGVLSYASSKLNLRKCLV